MRTRHHIFSQLHPGKSILCSCCMALIVCLFTACDSKQPTSRKPTLTVTLEPLRYFTETIAGDKFKVVSMVPKGSSPETYDPTPQQLVNLDKSIAYLRIGYIGFEQAWMDKLTTNAPHLKIFDTSKGIDVIQEAGYNHGDHHHEGGIEPHIWNSARNASVIARNIYAALIYHPALSYFARDYGLKQISIEERGKEPSPAHLKELIETCRRDNARVIFVQQEFDTRNARLIADELGITVVPINPLSYEWQEEMINVAKALAK